CQFNVTLDSSEFLSSGKHGIAPENTRGATPSGMASREGFGCAALQLVAAVELPFIQIEHSI
ncbi:MAG: hypothetical protein RR068_17080, partial [Hafnia sp.]